MTHRILIYSQPVNNITTWLFYDKCLSTFNDIKFYFRKYGAGIDELHLYSDHVDQQVPIEDVVNWLVEHDLLPNVIKLEGDSQYTNGVRKILKLELYFSVDNVAYRKMF